MSLILAIETSSEVASCALLSGATVLSRESTGVRTHSQSILPMVQELLTDAGVTLAQCDAIAFGAGPGSFTGIRIGCGVAQGLALGAELPVVAVPTLAAIAQEVFRTRGWDRVLACLDARMHEVYTAAYARGDGAWREVAPPSVLPPAAVQHPHPVGDAGWQGAGNGFAAYPGLAAQLELSGIAADARPTAQSIGELAVLRFAAGEGVAAIDALPLYVRHRVALTSAEQGAGARL